MMYFILLVLVASLGWAYWSALPFNTPTTPAQNTSSGVVSYGKESVDSLTCNGLVTLDGTQVKHTLEVNGSLKAMGATINRLTVHGHAHLINSTIKGKSELFGFFTASQSTFQAPLTLHARSCTFTDSTVHSIIVTNPTWVIGSQTVTLSGKTVVKGSIVFESGKGIVQLDPQAKVLGQIVGGKIN